jgi:predicted DNA-binding transcriptional regulator YafY
MFESYAPVVGGAPEPAFLSDPSPTVRGMNRTDRLYAIVEELRAVAPRPRSAGWLADRFEVSSRTIERDIDALQQTGVPLYAEPGRTGGYVVDVRTTLPPLNVSAAESAAIALALEGYRGPFAAEARTALGKVLTAMSGTKAQAAGDLAGRVRLIAGAAAAPCGHPATTVIEEAVARHRVVRLSYVDKNGEVTSRDVEPVSLVGSTHHRYLIGWCRLRGATRAFRLDRVQRAVLTGAEAPQRRFDEAMPPDVPPRTRVLTLTPAT